jgi:hypothetical protein
MQSPIFLSKLPICVVGGRLALQKSCEKPTGGEDKLRKKAGNADFSRVLARILEECWQQDCEAVLGAGKCPQVPVNLSCDSGFDIFSTQTTMTNKEKRIWEINTGNLIKENTEIGACKNGKILSSQLLDCPIAIEAKALSGNCAEFYSRML